LTSETLSHLVFATLRKNNGAYIERKSRNREGPAARDFALHARYTEALVDAEKQIHARNYSMTLCTNCSLTRSASQGEQQHTLFANIIAKSFHQQRSGVWGGRELSRPCNRPKGGDGPPLRVTERTQELDGSRFSAGCCEWSNTLKRRRSQQEQLANSRVFRRSKPVSLGIHGAGTCPQLGAGRLLCPVHVLQSALKEEM
jgi:hypothetical protein